VEANAFDFLRAAADAGEQYDMIVLDPPAFAKNRRALERAYRGYKEINLRAMRMLVPGGILVTCSCSHHMDRMLFEEMLLDAANDVGRRVRIVQRRGAAPDHPVLLGMPETEYLKCYVLHVWWQPLELVRHPAKDPGVWVVRRGCSNLQPKFRITPWWPTSAPTMPCCPFTWFQRASVPGRWPWS